MANLIRSAKSADKWKYSDLDAYNIRISTVDTEEFFGVPSLPAPTVGPIILNHVETPVGIQLSRDTSRFFRLLKVVATPTHGNDPATTLVADFSFHILRFLLRFSEPDRLMLCDTVLRFVMSGEQVKAKLDVALVDSENCILLILENKNPFSQDQAEPRLVAKALAAFQTDCDPTEEAGLPPMLSKRYIGIVMNGSAPHFYKITITQALVYAVRYGLFPAEETVVERFIPPVPDVCEGMLSLRNRHVCFQCFEALKTLL